MYTLYMIQYCSTFPDHVIYGEDANDLKTLLLDIMTLLSGVSGPYTAGSRARGKLPLDPNINYT